jgi:uncharacterized protein YuzE
VEVGELAMQFRFDEDANALSIALHEGQVARTIEITDMVYVDVDVHGTPLGVEFVSADEFIPFLRRLRGLEKTDAWADVIPAEVRELFSANAA